MINLKLPIFPILADETGFHPTLEAVFDLKYPETLVDATYPNLSIYQPLDFHDRHLDPFLSLKSVKPLGFSISEYLSQFCDEEIMDFVRQNEQPLRSGLFFRPRPPVPKRLNEAYDVGRYYVQHIADITTRFPSKLYLRPSDEYWNALVYVATPVSPDRWEYVFRTPTELSICDEGQMRRLLPFPDDKLFVQMKTLGDKYPQIAIYEMFDFSEAARKLLEEMGHQEGFEWTTPGTGGYARNISPRELPPDATSGLWSKISSALEEEKKLLRSTGKQGRPSMASSKNTAQVNTTIGTKARSRPEKTVQAAVRKGTRGRSYRPAAKDYLQHAWRRAVEVDATFIIFHCGKAERIGFRHRETQTLYLSELIDPSTVEKYGKIQIGLHLAIVKDVLEREASLSPRKKRSAESMAAGQQPSKRQKRAHETEDVVSNPSAELLSKSLASRNLALISLDHGLYRSRVPSSFFRVESSWDLALKARVDKEPRTKAKYHPSQYFSLTLGDQIGRGAVGSVYRASARFVSGSKTFQYSRLVVKVAFLERQQAPLRHEYAIYKLLASRGVAQNILPVYGMFQDAETGLLILVLEYGGDSLATRQTEDGMEGTFTEQEKTTIANAFRRLHGAGIIHGDIRSNNLLLDPSGAFYIIDFDQAEVDPDEEYGFKGEINELSGLLRIQEHDDDDEDIEDDDEGDDEDVEAVAEEYEYVDEEYEMTWTR